MSFYAWLILINVASFVPLYLANCRAQPNPIAFAIDRSNWNRHWLKLVYIKYGYTDPFRIHLDYSCLILSAHAAGVSGTAVAALAAAVWTAGEIVLIYSAIMQFVFNRAPSLHGDIELVRAGLHIGWRYRAAIAIASLGLIAVFLFASFVFSDFLLGSGAGSPLLSALGVVLLLLPGLYHARKSPYTQFIFRTVYSPLLHLYRNVRVSGRFKQHLARDRAYFRERNHFATLELVNPPSVVTICVESYGSVFFEDENFDPASRKLLRDYDAKLAQCGYHVASAFSEAPIFAGGSWLSYTTFTYGTRFDDLHLHQRLFTGDHDFADYESLFHVLKRNGYPSYVLCPMAGLDLSTMDWSILDRSFRSDRNFDYHAIDYRGEWLDFFSKRGLRVPPDQFSLNKAHELITRAGSGPYSLFFCTLNSHYPWDSPAQAVADWQDLGNAAHELRMNSGTLRERYASSIRYQLDYLLKFALDREAEDPLLVLFGDHQPPLLTPREAGQSTPVHIISKSAALQREFLNLGFIEGFDLHAEAAVGVKHEAMLSILMRGMRAAYGKPGSERIPYLPDGAGLFDRG